MDIKINKDATEGAASEITRYITGPIEKKMLEMQGMLNRMQLLQYVLTQATERTIVWQDDPLIPMLRDTFSSYDIASVYVRRDKDNSKVEAVTKQGMHGPIEILTGYETFYIKDAGDKDAFEVRFDYLEERYAEASDKPFSISIEYIGNKET